MAVNLDRVVAVVSKAPDQRNGPAIESLLPWFKKKAETFSNLKNDVVKDIVRNCELTERLRDNVIIKQGEIGDCFYIMLRGKVSIYINNLISDEEDETKIAEHSKTGTEYYNDKGELDRSRFGNFIANIGDGKSFGELALINKNCIRNASIIADESTLLLVVSRELYNRSLHAVQAAEIDEKNRFVAEHPFFQTWAVKYKRQLVYSIRKERIQYLATITRQGEPANAIYFILRGQAKILIDGCLHPNQFPQCYPLVDPREIMAKEEMENDFFPQTARKKEHQPDFYKPIGPVPPSAQRRREVFRKPKEVSLVEKNEIIGDTEFALDLKTYLQSVECTLVTEVYALDLKNYERLVTKRNPKTIDALRAGAEIKMRSRLERLHDDALPLLRSLLFKMELIDRQNNQKFKRRTSPSPAPPKTADVVPQRGPLIDQHGPGTVFYRSKMRELAKKKSPLRSSANYRGGRMGFAIPMTQLAPTSFNVLKTTAEESSDEDARLMKAKIPAEKFSSEDEMYSGSELEKDEVDGPSGGPESFRDFESSDKALSSLEDRIKAWYSSIQKKGASRKNSMMLDDHLTNTIMRNKSKMSSPVKLRRVTLDKGKELIPGRKIVLRKKKPRHIPGEYGHFLEEEEEDLKEVAMANKLPSRTRAAVASTGATPNAYDADGDTGPYKTTVYSHRVQRLKEAATMVPAIYELPGDHVNGDMTVAMILRMHTDLSDEGSDMSDNEHPAPPENEGTILDILINRKPPLNKSELRKKRLAASLTFNTLRPICLHGSHDSHVHMHSSGAHSLPILSPTISSKTHRVKAPPSFGTGSSLPRIPRVEVKSPPHQGKQRKVTHATSPHEVPSIMSLMLTAKNAQKGGVSDPVVHVP